MTKLALRGDGLPDKDLRAFAAQCGLPVWSPQASSWLTVVPRLGSAEPLSRLHPPCIGLIEADGGPSPDWVARLIKHSPAPCFFASLTTTTAFDIDLAQSTLAALAGFGVLAEDRIDALRLPIHEAVANGLIHGNLEIDNVSRESLEEFEVYAKLLSERLANPHYGDRHLELSVTIQDSDIVVVVHDQGRGYDVSRPVKGLKSGRGLAIIRSMVSSVDVGEDGRLIRLRFPR